MAKHLLVQLHPPPTPHTQAGIELAAIAHAFGMQVSVLLRDRGLEHSRQHIALLTAQPEIRLYSTHPIADAKITPRTTPQIQSLIATADTQVSY